MHPPRLLLIRHGQTAWNVERRFLGRTDLPLDAVGEAQATRLGLRLAATPLAGVWSSPLTRARQTAAPLPGGAAPRVHPGLVEIDMGRLEGLSGTEFLAEWPDVAAAWRDHPHAVELPGGERLADVQTRALAALAVVAADVAPGQTVAVVTHQLVLATLVCHYNGAPLATFRTYMHRNTGITTLEFGDAARVVAFDDAAHLDG